MSSDSDFEDDMDNIMLFPLTDLDGPYEDSSESSSSSSTSGSDTDIKQNKFNNNKIISEDYDQESKPKPLQTLRQRRRMKLTNLNLNHAPTLDTPTVAHWKSALLKVKNMADPWAEFHIEEIKTEKALRHRYNALRKQWFTDTVEVKMETKAFNRGAMRQCYRLKKLSTFSTCGNWKHASNYVAKHYLEDVDREVYFDDVRLQMDAKLWGEEYNRHNPPKKVDIFQMYVLEFKDREDSPLYHLEHFIEGKYIKYNSNSGFVEETTRLTPQAFSHFTFERSGHQVIVVDIQGVGDLYTDPQIHTASDLSSGKCNEYGDGNLGSKGMALFFHSHACNNICKSLGLSQFDLTQQERDTQKKYIELMLKANTVVKGQEEICYSASPCEKVDLTEFLRKRTISGTSISSNTSDTMSPRSDEDDEPMSATSPPDSAHSHHSHDHNHEGHYHGDHHGENLRWSLSSDPTSPMSPGGSSVRTESDSGTLTVEEEKLAFSRALKQVQRPASIAQELCLRCAHDNLVVDDSTLGMVHHEMAKYHEIGRFSPEGLNNTQSDNDKIDWESAIFHEDIAAQCGVMEAILTMARIYLNLPHDVLQNCTVQENSENITMGVRYMDMAARVGDRAAMIFMAKAYETGMNLGNERTRCWAESVKWFEKAVKTEEHDDSGGYDATMDDPAYQLLAKQADMYLQGGWGLEKDPSKAGDLYTEAADAAMAAFKGRLANKYFGLAEEAWAEVEEVEE